MNTNPTIVPQVQGAAAAITPPQMLAMAIQQGADIDKLSKLLDLQERWEQAQSRKAFNIAISSFRQDCPTIARTQTANNNRKYAGLACALEQINELLSGNGLSHSWRTTQDGAAITVTCTVTHRDGHSEYTSLTAMPDKTGSKNEIQAVGSTVTYLQRYTLFSILGLASAEQDDDGECGARDDISDAVSALLACESMADLQAAFSAAWKANPSKGTREALTRAKDDAKARLLAMEADNAAAQ